MRLKILKMKQDDMNKQSYSNYVILISSDGKQSNVFSISVLLVITILSGFRVTAIGLPSISLKNLGVSKKIVRWGEGVPPCPPRPPRPPLWETLGEGDNLKW